jgi:hypothetical protein
MKLMEIKPEYYEGSFPKDLELKEGILYISKKYSTAIHLCACGCKQKTVTPLNDDDKHRGWTLNETDGKVSLSPSIGNFKGENPYHAHYFIVENKIQWC